MASPSAPAAQSDRAALLKAFDEACTGVRGLVESSVSSVPALFVHLDPYASAPLAPLGVSIPVVDLSLPAPAATEAARNWGFFHLINHYQALGIPEDYPARALAAVRAFNEVPAAERSTHYGRSMAGRVSYFSNVDLFRTSAASWRDTVQIAFGPQRPDPARIPTVCCEELLEWDVHATAVGRALLRLPGRVIFKGLTRSEVGHYCLKRKRDDLKMGCRKLESTVTELFNNSG
ncbi:1-aminocyclopropane-1-carboxylate oxidase homolog 1-like [Setaria italica]|uniref:1-aminocyclopropane-1-carboxylate oxidase homolog 1-like n=1 Tax=Setaria italica TaxID=4555 RepID=UPI000350FE28|nr:1-aminocyclopropane-1-carboxylate oxidase homolog 1-like [Setaria italica]